MAVLRLTGGERGKKTHTKMGGLFIHDSRTELSSVNDSFTDLHIVILKATMIVGHGAWNTFADLRRVALALVTPSLCNASMWALLIIWLAVNDSLPEEVILSYLPASVQRLEKHESS